MDVDQISLEVEMEELLFQEMFTSPAKDHVQNMKDLDDINVKNASQRTLLHQAVMLGKLDWVREILEAGADPLIEDKYGRSALQIASDIVSDHPGDTEREEIKQLVQSRHNSSQPSNCKSTERVADSINKLKMFLFTEISASKSSIETRMLEISGDLTTVKQSYGEIKKELEELKKELGNTESTPKEALERISREQEIGSSIVNSLKQSVADLGNGIKGLDSMVTTQRESFEEFKKELGNTLTTQRESLDEVKKELGNTDSKVNALQSLLTTEHTSIKESMATQKNELFAEMENSKKNQSAIQNVLERVESMCVEIFSRFTPKPVEVTTPPGPTMPEYKPDREDCVEAMMRKTELKPSNEGNISKMKRWYEMLYDEDHITSCILEFLQFHSRVKVSIDFESTYIGRIKPTLRDHDGIERSGGDFGSFADFEERKAFVGGKWSNERLAIAHLADALSQLSVYLAFNNRGLPYSGEGDGGRFKRILEEAERKKRDGVELHYWIEYALSKQNQHGKEIYLTPAVPYMIARYGSSDGRSKLSAQLPSLLEYYDQHVVATLSKETKKIFESARG